MVEIATFFKCFHQLFRRRSVLEFKGNRLPVFNLPFQARIPHAAAAQRRASEGSAPFFLRPMEVRQEVNPRDTGGGI